MWLMILTVVFAHFLALLSPGPDFILVVKSGVRNTKRNALGIAVGIAAANAVYIALCIVGIGEILSRSIVVMKVLKLCGGLFLTYVAIMALKSRKKDYAFLVESEGDPRTGGDRGRGSSFAREFLTGFLSGISNPKNLIFYLSLFSVVLTAGIDLRVKVGLGVWMTLLVFAWDASILLVLSKRAVRSVFSRIAFYVDKVAGTILGLIGVRLIETAILEDR